MKHRGKRVLATAKKIKTVSFMQLDSGVREDIALCIKDMVMSRLRVDDFNDPRWRDPEDVLWALEHMPQEVTLKFPLLNVDPALLDACKQRSLYADRLSDFEEIWKSKSPSFPPIVINTDDDEWVLCEGGHRTCSAEKVGIKKIRAVDIAGLDYDPILVALELNG